MAEEFETLRAAIDADFGPDTQALAWSQPDAVGCDAITGALAPGFDVDLCRHSRAPSGESAYANSAWARPLRDQGTRLSMRLAASDVDAARRPIDRGVAADRTLGLRGVSAAQVHILATFDRDRNVRARRYLPAGLQPHALASSST